MVNDELPCLDLLEATPAILRGLMSEISEEDARWKPAPDRFSIAEVLSHLSHSEGHCYRERLDRFLSEEMPEFEPDDAQMHLDVYRNADPEEDFGHFEDQRETNVELLRGLRPRAHTPDCGTGPRQEVSWGSRTTRRGLQAQAMIILIRASPAPRGIRSDA